MLSLTTTPVVAGRQVNISCLSDGRPPPGLHISPGTGFNVSFESVLNNSVVNETRVQTLVTAIADRSWHNQEVHCNRTSLFPEAQTLESIKVNCTCKYTYIIKLRLLYFNGVFVCVSVGILRDS